jgi:ribosomal protein L3 glutamine methyltransferase
MTNSLSSHNVPLQTTDSVGGVSAAEAIESFVTIADWLRFTESQLLAHRVFFGHGYQDAAAEASLLISGILQLPPDGANRHIDARLAIKERFDLLHALIERCVKRRPLAYVTGEIWFNEQRFLCDERALIPRSLLVELLTPELSPWIANDEGIESVLDLCTGGGSIAIFAHQALPHAVIWASDISPEALALARDNCRLHHIKPADIQLIESDLFEGLKDTKFNLILCNPPYVNADSIDHLPQEYLHEPPGALAAGIDGMDVIKKIIQNAPEHLYENGLLLLEIGNEAPYFDQAFGSLEFAYVPVESGLEMVVAVTREAIVHWRDQAQ